MFRFSKGKIIFRRGRKSKRNPEPERDSLPPINYVKAKLVLESLDSDDILEVLLDEGEPMDNIPKNPEADGYNILKIKNKTVFTKLA